MNRRLVIISPCRDEAAFVQLTLESVVNQTRPPDLWIIVDDGSRDASPEVVAPYTEKHPWIKLVRRQRDGRRQLGPGVVHAFQAGLPHVGDAPFDVIAKLDCDLEFGPDCLARILALFDDPQVGMAGGAVLLKVGDQLVPERYPSYHIAGATKFYRWECFRDIGGPQPLYGWDILDETEARRHGWTTLSDPDVIFITPRMQGETLGVLQGRIVWGRGAYAIGGHPLFTIARGIYRMAERPWLVGGLALIWGFFSSYFHPEIQRNHDGESIRYLRREQLYRLTHGNRLPARDGRRWIGCRP